MGTNFYLVDKCSCGETEKLRIHLGKRSAGWAFSFRGYTEEQLPDGCHNVKKVTTIEEWVDLITQHCFELVDEYGSSVPDLCAFIDECKARQGKQHAIECRGQDSYSAMVGGHSFTFCEFS